MKKYIIACSKPWFLQSDKIPEFANTPFEYITRKEELSLAHLSTINPRYIFFPHWSWLVPADIHTRFECVCFHTAPLPYGRGGSPLQNLIIRNIETSPVCALKMTDSLDGGPIYASSPVSLLGSLDEIFIRISICIQNLILDMIKHEPVPREQTGEAVYFPRRKAEESEIPDNITLSEIFNFIRMLDGEGYPPAFITHGDYKIEFKSAIRRMEGIEAHVSIKKEPDHSD